MTSPHPEFSAFLDRALADPDVAAHYEAAQERDGDAIPVLDDNDKPVGSLTAVAVDGTADPVVHLYLDHIGHVTVALPRAELQEMLS